MRTWWLTIIFVYLQANVNKEDDPKTWQLNKLCERMCIFCRMLGEGENPLTPENVIEECGDDFEEIRYYLRERITEAYKQKVRFNI